MSDTPSDDTTSETPESPNGGKPKPKSGLKLLLMLIGVAVIAFVIVVAGYDYFSKHNAGSGSAGTGSPTVGGPFTLVNQAGETVTEKTYRGKYMLIFFGYTYCPDVCPTALTDMATALDMLPEGKASEIVPIFISVDPTRDTPQHLAEYVSFFHPRTVGLTGSEEQVKAVTRAYRVYHSKNAPEGSDPQDYLVDHTSIVYLVGPDGKLVTHFSHGTSPQAMAERLGQLL